MLDILALAAAAIPRRNSDKEPQRAIGGLRAEQFDFAEDEPAFDTRQAGAEVAEGDLVIREVATPRILSVRAEAVSQGTETHSNPLPPPSLPPIGGFVIGSSADEELSGTAMADFIDGRGGDDVLKGGYGNDLLFGGDGNDVLRGGRGTDELHGGAGDDEIFGGPGADIAFGEDGNDVLVGNGGNDALRGGLGDDQLFGGKGRDDLRGGLGDDLLVGGPGRDRLIGGPGRDTFRTDEVNHGIDQILDFEAGVGGDTVDLHNVLDFELGDDINDFVQLIERNNNTRVAVNVDGFGDEFTVVFNLVGQIGLDLGALVNDGNMQLTDAPSS